MSSDLDLPLLPSAEQIRRREFATVRRGYDPDQVRDYLQHVSSQVETLEQGAPRDADADRHEGLATDTARSRAMTAGAARPSGAPSVRRCTGGVPDDNGTVGSAERFAEMIQTADEQVDKVLDEAQAEAARILEEARDRGRSNPASTHRRVPRRLGRWATMSCVHAKEEAERILGSLADRRETLVTQMQEMQSRSCPSRRTSRSASSDPISASPRSKRWISGPTARPGPRSRPGRDDDDMVDPRYEDLWVSTKTPRWTSRTWSRSIWTSTRTPGQGVERRRPRPASGVPDPSAGTRRA